MNTTITLMTTPATGLSSFVVATLWARTAPNGSAQGTGLSFAGALAPAAAQVAVHGARRLSLPDSSPRGAPV